MDAAQLYAFVKKHWSTWPGFLAANLLTLSILGAGLKDALPASMYLSVLGLAVFGITGAWVKTKFFIGGKGKLRFIVAIYCDKEDQADEIEEDFVRSLRQLIRAGKPAE